MTQTAAKAVCVGKTEGFFMNLPKISKRIEAAASFCRSGVRIADIGTDHAYLPIYLHAAGKISGGVASDINAGPVERAKMNIARSAASRVISVVRTDGLCGIEAYAPDDIFILGMGGELIATILDKAPWVRSKKHRLVLQPMTHPELLRAYLYENGFSIIDEALVSEDKIYHVICAEYGGEIYNATREELMFGKKNLLRGGELLRELAVRTRDIYSKRAEGKRVAGADDSEETEILKITDRIIGGQDRDRT